MRPYVGQNGWVLAMVPVVLLVSYLSYVILEMPSRRFINGLGRRPPARVPETVG